METYRMKAHFVKEITVIDPDTGGDVEVLIFKEEGGGMFGVDSSYVDYTDGKIVQSPFCNGTLDLIGID